MNEDESCDKCRHYKDCLDVPDFVAIARCKFEPIILKKEEEHGDKERITRRINR